MSLSRITAGNDFTMEITVVQPQYEITGTVWNDFDLTDCKDIKVNLICTKDKVVIPVEWQLKENTNNIIIVDVKGKMLHSSAVYALEITGLDSEDKAWRYKNGAVFSIVDETDDAVLDAELMADPLEINAQVGLALYVEPITGPQGPQGEQGPQGISPQIPSNIVTGYQAGVAQSGIKIDVVSSLPASPDSNTLYVIV